MLVGLITIVWTYRYFSNVDAFCDPLGPLLQLRLRLDGDLPRGTAGGFEAEHVIVRSTPRHILC